MGSIRDYFIPHDGNGYAPHALQKTAAILMAVMIVLTFAIANMQSLLWITSDWMISTILPAVVIIETNEERSTESLSPLTRSPILDYAATMKAENMAKEEYFAHYSPAGVSPWHWFNVAGYEFIHAGENLAVHFKDSSQVVQAWMDSPTHRANIMKAEYKEIGIGVAEGTYEGYDTVFVVQLFGTPIRAYAPTPVAGTNDLSIFPTASSTIATTTSEDDEDVLALAEVEARVSGESIDNEVIEETPAPLTILPEDTFLSTTTSGAGVFAEVDHEEKVSTVAVLATQPAKVLQIVYVALALFVLVLLGLSVFIEIKHQQPLQVIYACVMLLMMSGFWWLHTALIGTILIV